MPTKGYRCCIVPNCKSTSYSTPEKLFVSVPKEASRRKAWYKAVRRGKIHGSSVSSSMHCCEDHFNMEEDMENFLRYKMMPGGRLQSKKHIIPHIFNSQPTKPVVRSRRRSLEARLRGESAQGSQSASDAGTSYKDFGPVQPKNETDFDEESAEVLPSFGFVDVSASENFDPVVPKREPLAPEEEFSDVPPPSNVADFSPVDTLELVQPKVEEMTFEEECVQMPPPTYFSSPEKRELDASRIEILRVETVSSPTFGTTPEKAESEEDYTLPAPEVSDFPDLVVESAPVDLMQDPGPQLLGRRIVDIAHLTTTLLKLGEHPKSCTFGRYEYQREVRAGLFSTLVFGCKSCRRCFHVTTTPLAKKEELNDSFVLGTSAAGIGFTQAKAFMATLEVPMMSAAKFQSCKRKVSREFGAVVANSPPPKRKKLA